MLGKNLLWVAKQHGHSVQTMLDVYAAWIEGSKESDLEAIRQAMESSPRARSWIAAGVSALQRQRRMEVTPPRAPISPQNLAPIWYWNRGKPS